MILSTWMDSPMWCRWWSSVRVPVLGCLIILYLPMSTAGINYTNSSSSTSGRVTEQGTTDRVQEVHCDQFHIKWEEEGCALWPMFPLILGYDSINAQLCLLAGGLSLAGQTPSNDWKKGALQMLGYKKTRPIDIKCSRLVSLCYRGLDMTLWDRNLIYAKRNPNDRPPEN